MQGWEGRAFFEKGMLPSLGCESVESSLVIIDSLPLVVGGGRLFAPAMGAAVVVAALIIGGGGGGGLAWDSGLPLALTTGT